jgi:iron(II)-dependent oxidoreductase
MPHEDWEPMSPMLRYGVYARRWPLAEQTIWTIVNRNEYDVDGDQIQAPAEKPELKSSATVP